jgi:hypothetical protein
MNKREARKRRIEWADAIAEGRVVRVDNGDRFRSFTTVAEAQEAERVALADGRQANIVKEP